MKPFAKIALAVVLIIAIGGILGALYMYNLKPKDLKTVKPDFVITAVELTAAFNEDVKAATDKYVNKVIEVSGEISSVMPGEKGAVNIQLESGNNVTSVICTIPNAGDTKTFEPGKAITLRGVCSGFLMDVLLNNCVAVEKKN